MVLRTYVRWMQLRERYSAYCMREKASSILPYEYQCQKLSGVPTSKGSFLRGFQKLFKKEILYRRKRRVLVCACLCVSSDIPKMLVNTQVAVAIGGKKAGRNRVGMGFCAHTRFLRHQNPAPTVCIQTF